MNNTNKIRTRYAPSPTGYFHVGGARTALFNYLYAKHNNGDFIVRIEDTDFERNVKDGIESQLSNLKWLGIKIDESIENPGQYGPYIQSQKLDRYVKLAQQLVSEKKAYYCFCTKEELEQNRTSALSEGQAPKYNRHCMFLSDKEIQEKIQQKIPHVIRLKMDDNLNIEWEDLIRGKISVPTSALTDPVILKSNQIATYNFAVVVDDYDMNITNAIRGEEHISNTPYQKAIKNALGFNSKPIQYGHLSVIINKEGKKLSKRDSSLKQFIQDYQDMGFYPHAVTNFLALLGWAPKDNVEIMSLEQLTKKFDISSVSKSPTFFDFDKMMWVSNKYFNQISEQEYLGFVDKFVSIDLGKISNRKSDIVLLFKKQINYASQINQLISETFFNFDPKTISSEIASKLKSDLWIKTINTFSTLISRHKAEINFDEAKALINQTKTESQNNGQDLFMPIRLILTLSEHGPELNKIISILGKAQIIERLNKIKDFFKW